MPEEEDVSPVSTAPATPTSPYEFKMLPLFMDFEDFVSHMRTLIKTDTGLVLSLMRMSATCGTRE